MNNQLSLNFYSILILLFLRYFIAKYPHQISKTEIWYKRILFFNILVLILDSIAWLVDGYPGKMGYLLVNVSNGMLIVFTLLPLSLWLVYLDICIIKNENIIKKRQKIYASINLLVVIMIVTNPFTNWTYVIDNQNHYIRQTGIYVLMAINFILFFGYVLSLIPYRQYIGGRIYQVILFLGSLPLLGAITQILYFGTTMVWPMFALVAFATYVLIEREEIKKDGLTGLSTRSQLEERMLYLTRKRHKFSVMMVDLNKFKKINDNYGHDEGDKALKTIANILEKSIRQSDLVYRYAGDEFILLLETESKLTAKMVGERINNNLNKVNLSGNKPYKLSLSIGLAHYDGNLDIDIYDLISLADKEMYKNKKLKELEITE